MKAAELFVAALEHEGVEYVFGLPGEENLAFIEALQARPGVRTILVRQEQAAGFMAAAYARLTGKIAVAYSTLGAGATNLATAAAHAHLGGFPVLFVTGQKPVRENRQGLYQLLDIPGYMTPLTKSARTVESGLQVPHVVHDAFRTMTEGRPGPVHVELPEDVAEDETDGRVSSGAHAVPPVAEPAALDAAAEALRRARSPLLMLGVAAERGDVPDSVRAFTDATGIPFFCTWMARGVGDERSPRFLGAMTMPGMDYVGAAAAKADVIVNVGHDIAEKAPFLMSAEKDQTVIHVNTFAAHGDAIYFPQLQVVGEIGHTLRELQSRVGSLEDADHGFALEMAERMRISIAKNSEDPGEGAVRPQYLVARVREVLDDDAIVTLDNGVHKLWFTRNLPMYTPRSHLVDSALGSMGPALPAAITAALVHPDRQVLAVAGDGGFMMNVQELETAVRLGVSLTVMILNDNGLGMIRMKQMRDGYQRSNVDFENPDFAALAESFGARGHRITEPGSVGDVLAGALAEGGVHVIDVPIDYRENPGLLKEMKMAAAPASS